jgi:hypothetical protein
MLPSEQPPCIEEGIPLTVIVLEQSVYMTLRDSYMSPCIIMTGDSEGPVV